MATQQARILTVLRSIEQRTIPNLIIDEPIGNARFLLGPTSSTATLELSHIELKELVRTIQTETKRAVPTNETYKIDYHGIYRSVWGSNGGEIATGGGLQELISHVLLGPDYMVHFFAIALAIKTDTKSNLRDVAEICSGAIKTLIGRVRQRTDSWERWGKALAEANLSFPAYDLYLTTVGQQYAPPLAAAERPPGLSAQEQEARQNVRLLKIVHDFVVVAAAVEGSVTDDKVRAFAVMMDYDTRHQVPDSKWRPICDFINEAGLVR